MLELKCELLLKKKKENISPLKKWQNKCLNIFVL